MTGLALGDVLRPLRQRGMHGFRDERGTFIVRVDAVGEEFGFAVECGVEVDGLDLHLGGDPV